REEEQYGIAEYTDDRPVREEFVSKTAPTMNMIDHILRCGSNEPDSLDRIVRQFQKNKSTEENAEFLKKEFGEDGRGYIIDEYSQFRVSAWFDESGIYVAVSDTAFPTGKRSHIGWDKAADHIREMLEKGEYCPQEIIDRARDNDIQDIARKLWYLRQDSNIPFFIPEHFFDGGFDESIDRIAEVLHESNLLNEISEGLARYIEMLKDNPNILRFRFHNPEQLLERIKDLQVENINGLVRFKTRPGYMPVEQRFFISEDEKDWLLMHGSGISGGKFRIEEYFKQEHNAKEKADFLKEEYGTGGSGRTGYDTWHDSKGITLRKGKDGTSCQTEMKWNEAAKRIDRLVSAGKYISQKDIEQRIRSAKYDIEHSDINYAHDRTIVESAMKVLDEYGVEYDVPEDYDVLCILADRFTEHHDGKFQVEGFYRATNPSTEELADFIQNLLENEKQGFGLKDYAAGPNGIVFTDLTEYSWEQVAKAVASAIDSGKYISPDERAENDDTPKYTIYQIPAGEEYHYIRFTPYELLEKMGQLPDPKNYAKVYSGRLDDIEYRDKPEGIFVKFNTDRPDDFDGHSLSVSDVIVIDEESGKKAYYVDDVGYKDITDIFLGLTEQRKDTPEQTEEKSEPVITSGIIEKYGLDIDFTKIDSVLLHTESTRYEGGIDENGHERRDNFSRDISDVSIYYSANDNSFIRSDSSDEAAFFGTDNSKITIDAALTEIQQFLDEAVDDSEKSVYIKYGDGRSQYIDAAKLLEVIKSENEPARKKSGSDIEVGDRFLYNDREYTVTSEKGIYPYDVSVSYEEKTGDITYIGTQNINRYKLAENGIYLGNPEKEHAQSPVGTETNVESYEPKIGDVIEYQKKLFVIADVSGGNVTLQTADTLIPETTVVPVTDLITSDSLDVVDERGKPAETDVHTKPVEEKPKVRNFVITDDNFGVPGGAKSRYADNVEAIKLLKTIESENRTATPEEQKILAKYTGWGAIPQAFDIGNDKWRDEYMELR
ncbi:MAG: YodL domain-containing protein, partial [Huintestinicola sp.]